MANGDLWGLGQYMPAASGGFSALGAIFNLIQTIQRNRQLQSLYGQAGDQGPAVAALNRLYANAAAGGKVPQLFPGMAAQLVANAYAPWNLDVVRSRAGLVQQGQQPPPIANPFDAFLKALVAYRGLASPPTTSGGSASGTPGSPGYVPEMGLGSVGSPGGGSSWTLGLE